MASPLVETDAKTENNRSELLRVISVEDEIDKNESILLIAKQENNIASKERSDMEKDK